MVIGVSLFFVKVFRERIADYVIIASMNGEN
jgi:hypothetical protein